MDRTRKWALAGTLAGMAALGVAGIVVATTPDATAAFGIEIRRPDGSVIEVSLDPRFGVLGEALDDDGPRDAAGD